MAPSAQIVEFKEELNTKVKGYEHSTNGNLLVKLKYKRTEERSVKIPTGLVCIAGLEVVIQRAGVPLGCFACNQHGHSVQHCPLKAIQCAKCGKLGHEGKCFLARNIDAVLEMPDVEQVEFEEPVKMPEIPASVSLMQKPPRNRRGSIRPKNDPKSKESKQKVTAAVKTVAVPPNSEIGESSRPKKVPAASSTTAITSSSAGNALTSDGSRRESKKPRTDASDSSTSSDLGVLLGAVNGGNTMDYTSESEDEEDPMNTAISGDVTIVQNDT